MLPELMSAPMPEHQPARSSRRDLPEGPFPSTRTSGALVVDVVEHQPGAQTAGWADDQDQPATVVERVREERVLALQARDWVVAGNQRQDRPRRRADAGLHEGRDNTDLGVHAMRGAGALARERALKQAPRR